MEIVNSNNVSKNIKYGDLKVVMEVVGCDFNFSIIIEGLDGGVLREYKEVGKELIKKFWDVKEIEVDKRDECRVSEHIRNRLEEPTLVKGGVSDEVKGENFLKHSSLYVKMKISIPLNKT